MQHIYFSGIGGTAIGPLAMIAHQAGYFVSGSDKQSSEYIKYLKQKGLDGIHTGQTTEQISRVHAGRPIDWIVYSSAVPIENPSHPELVFAKKHGIKATKREELLNKIINDSGNKLIAIAGTHGKTTTTAMAIWLFQQLGIDISYSVGAKISFGEMGHFDKSSKYFVYECDEFDNNFLAFHPEISVIAGIDYDHHEFFPTRKSYLGAFEQFLKQSKSKILWLGDLEKLDLVDIDDGYMVLSEDDALLGDIDLPGLVNRKDAMLAIAAANKISDQPIDKMVDIMQSFPGVSRRFEKIAENLYSDYAHTAEKIRGSLQLAGEISGNIVVVYEPLTDRRQHFIKSEYKNLFRGVKKLYWTPSYLAREDKSQTVLSPSELIKEMDNPKIAEPAELNKNLKEKIISHQKKGDVVLCLSGGGGGSLDEWLRQEFIN